MAIYCLGSINIDHIYRVPHLPEPGETLAALSYQPMLGGKGANQSIAAAQAGRDVHHIGAVGADGDWIVARMCALGVGVENIRLSDEATGAAVVNVDPAGENAIVIFSGANNDQDEAHLRTALVDAGPGDTLLLQNETNLQAEAAAIGATKGMRVIYSAAPFDLEAVRAVIKNVSILAVNALEADQLCAAFGVDLALLPVPQIVVTRGSEGAEWRSNETGERVFLPSVPVEPVDTTGAGDTFAGYFAAGLDQGLGSSEALDLARHAAALKVTRQGTGEAIPSLADVLAFRETKKGEA
ncbi:MAG: ribokinase [Paracoccaceae bacterium]